MSCHHRNLAHVWQQLEGRADLENVTREIIGQHYLDSTLLDDDLRAFEKSLRAIIWIKAIFDLQRCYLTGISHISELPSSTLSFLLPSDLIFTTILYLIEAKKRLFPDLTPGHRPEFARPRHVLVQSILSGLRLLVLRRGNLPVQSKRHLRKAIKKNWHHDSLDGVEGFIVGELIEALIDAQGTNHVNPYQREWENARLPTYAAGLYPLDIRPETFVTPLIHGTMEEDWIDAYWVLFDTLWAIECAVTQRYVDIHRQSSFLSPSHTDYDADEILEQLSQTRTSFIISVFHITGPMTPPPALMNSLASTLLEWNDALDSFLLRQDSLLHERGAHPSISSRKTSYGKHVSELNMHFDAAIRDFAKWLSVRKSASEQSSSRKTGVTSNDMLSMVKDWVNKITNSSEEILSKEAEGTCLPVYIVDCPKLHVMPKRCLEHKLRWCDKWAYESLKEDSPIINWKEDLLCPSCTSNEKIKRARLIEPFQHLTRALDNLAGDDLSQTSISGSNTYDAVSASTASRSASSGGSVGISYPSQSTMNISLPSQVSQPSADTDLRLRSTQFSSQLPPYTDSPISPTTLSFTSRRSQSNPSTYMDSPISPLTESLNVPIPMTVGSRLSVDLPIPVPPPSIPESMPETAPTPNTSDIRINSPITDAVWNREIFTKAKSSSRTVKIANSIRRKPISKAAESPPLPKDPLFVFSASGQSLLLWGKASNHLTRFDISNDDATAIQGCKYQATDIDVAAAGTHKCVVVAAGGTGKRKLIIYDGIKSAPAYETDIEFAGRPGEICLAVSKNDKLVATSMNDDIQLFSLSDTIKSIAFHYQMHVYELRGGISHKRVVPVERTTSDESIKTSRRTETGSWFGEQSRGLSFKEAAEEQQRQTAIVSRKLNFSPDNKRLVAATQLGDHCVYIDVWDCTREPVSTISEHSRSFKLPPWTLNDGDLTSVFYDSTRRCALITAFLGKEYPLLVPFPGYDTLQNETYSTKIVHAAQSPSGRTFVAANAMTEILAFEFTPKGAFSPRKLKKSPAKISNSVFKPGTIALAMPLEDCLRCFWVKDGKCMLRTVRIGAAGESIRDYDVRPYYDGLMMGAKSLGIPEMDAGGS